MLSYDEAIERALEAFSAAHPPATIPSWFAIGAFRDDSINEAGKIEVRFYVEPAQPLRSNQSWVETDRGPVLQEVDPQTGEVLIVISRDVRRNITLFRVTVDPVGGVVQVLEDCDITAISESDIEIPKVKIEQ